MPQLLNDPNALAQLLVRIDPGAVADQLGVLMNRPTTEAEIWQALDALLDNGRHTDFVNALAVPVDVDRLPISVAVAITDYVGPTAWPDEVGRKLAERVLSLATTVPETEQLEQPAAPAAPTPVAPMPASNGVPSFLSRWNRTAVFVFEGLVVVALLLTIAVAIKQLRQ